MANRRLRPADDLISPVVAASIMELTLADEDAAAVKLATMYAAAIDNAGLLAAALNEIDTDDEDLQHRVTILEAQVKEQAVLATLGPKLLACLTELGASPKARGALKGGGVDVGPNRLSALREARRAN